jgi:hypothetical protein
MKESVDLAPAVERLERQVRSLRRILAVALLGLGWPLLIAADAPRTPAEVTAKKFVLHDGAGKVRAELGLQPDGTAMLAFIDAKGRTNVALRGTASAPILELAEGSGGSAWVTSSSTGSGISLSMGGGEIELAANATGSPSVKLVDKNGKIVWSAP